MYENMSVAHARAALDSQSACNASALIHSLARYVDEIWAEARAQNKGTEYVNRHPLVVMFTAQLAHLSGCGMVSQETYGAAYNACNAVLTREETCT